MYLRPAGYMFPIMLDGGCADKLALMRDGAVVRVMCFEFTSEAGPAAEEAVVGGAEGAGGSHGAGGRDGAGEGEGTRAAEGAAAGARASADSGRWEMLGVRLLTATQVPVLRVEAERFDPVELFVPMRHEELGIETTVRGGAGAGVGRCWLTPGLTPPGFSA